MPQVTFTGKKAKVTVLVNGERVTLYFRQYRDKHGKVHRTIGSRHVRLTSGKKSA